MAAAIHEDDIKRVALSFMRSYYKHRPRSGEMRAETNLRGEGSIIVDSYLSFPTETGDTFIATAEATSVDTRDEVKYTIQHRLLFWDSVVFGVLISIFFFLLSSHIPYLSMPVLTPGLRLLVMLLFIIFFTIVYHAFIRPLRRYRYIYAIAQFKKYHADEQWVALGRSVFPMLDENTYYRELKRQCTRFGFGLILVDNQMQARMVVSASRIEQFERERRQLKLFSLSSYKKLREIGEKDWWWVNWWKKWTNPYREHDYFRFKSGFSHQLSLIGLGLVILAIFFLREKKRMPIYFPNESRYEKKLEEYTRQAPEAPPVAGDPKPFVVPFSDNPDESTLLNIDTIPPPEVIAIKPEAEVMIYDPYNQNIIYYDCERMYNFTGTRYLVTLGEFGDPTQAQDQLQILGDAGINGVVYWEGCFSPNREAFVMYLETMHDTEQEAQMVLDSVGEKLSAARLQARIQPVTPLINHRY